MEPLREELLKADRLTLDRSYTEAASAHMQIIAAAPDPRQTWEGLLADLAGLRMYDKAFEVVDERHRRFNDGLSLYYWALSWMMSRGLADLAEALIGHTPNNSLLCIVARYFAGTLALHRGGTREAASHFVAAGAVAEKFLDHFKSPELRAIIFEGRAFRKFDEFEKLAQEPRAAIFERSGGIEREAAFRRVPNAKAAPFVLYSAMNEKYLDRFGQDAVRAVAADLSDLPGAVYHLHVVDPTPEIEGKIDTLQSVAPDLLLGLSTETYRHPSTGRWRAAYYCSARFMRWREMFAIYQRPHCTVDIDIAKVAHLKAVMASLGEASFGCFELRERPALICHASLVATGADAPSEAFADLVAKFLATMIHADCFWTIDQMALLVASRFCMATNGAFRSVDLAKTSGIPFDKCFQSAGDFPEKDRMRTAA